MSRSKLADGDAVVECWLLDCNNEPYRVSGVAFPERKGVADCMRVSGIWHGNFSSVDQQRGTRSNQCVCDKPPRVGGDAFPNWHAVMMHEVGR